MSHVFTYGSLMFSPVWRRVVTRLYQKDAAMLAGYRRFKVVNEEYPAIVAAGSSVQLQGMVYYDIADDDLKRLDDFEGHYYHRQPVVVEVDGERLQAEAYVLRDMFRHLLSDQEWDVEDFAERGIHLFMRCYG